MQGHTILGLFGTGGVGKTALALKLAKKLTPEYPDAQIYIDLKGVDQHPLTSAQAMAHVIRSFHPQTQLPESKSELEALYLSVLHGNRVLLLMDNAAENGQKQVGLLIPPSSSLLLVTSRFRFALPGLVWRDLDELPLEEARNLLLKIAPQIGEKADLLVQLCGRLPLALRVAGSTLAERPDLSPSDYARRLQEGKERFDLVDASLMLSYELLTEDRRRFWRLLAVFPGAFERRAAAAVWEIESDLVLQVLGDLVRSSLIEWEEKDQRYRLHDLARSFANHSLEEAEGEGARRRHATYYFFGYIGSTDKLSESREEPLDRTLQLFETERDNLQAGFAWASAHYLEDEIAARIHYDFPDLEMLLLALRQYPPERIRSQERGLAMARKRRDKSSAVSYLGNLGLAYIALGAPRRSIEYYEQELAITRDIGDRRQEGQVLGKLGLAYAALGEPRKAVEHYEQSLAIAREIGDRRGEGVALSNLSKAYEALGDLRRSNELSEQVLAIARAIGSLQEEILHRVHPR